MATVIITNCHPPGAKPFMVKAFILKEMNEPFLFKKQLKVGIYDQILKYVTEISI